MEVELQASLRLGCKVAELGQVARNQMQEFAPLFLRYFLVLPRSLHMFTTSVFMGAS